jgi:hypothetical protein
LTGCCHCAPCRHSESKARMSPGTWGIKGAPCFPVTGAALIRLIYGKERGIGACPGIAARHYLQMPPAYRK